MCVLKIQNVHVCTLSGGFLDSVHVCGSQQFPQLFVGDIYGISELIEKIGVEVDTIKSFKADVSSVITLRQSE